MMSQNMTRKINTMIVGLLCVSFFCTTACTPKKIASDLTAQIMAKGAPSFEMEADVEVADRAVMALLKTMEVFQHDNPKNKTFNTLLARSYANYTMGFLEFDLMQHKLDKDSAAFEKYLNRTKLFYTRGKDYGLAALSTQGSFKKALFKDLKTFNKVLSHMGQKQVPVLFWTALNWGSLINWSKDSPLAIAQFPKVEAMMQRVLELDENYFFGVPHLYFGVSFSSRTELFGGSMPKAKEHFEKSISAYNRRFLMAQVYYAYFYALKMKDKDLFKSLLEEVVAADASALPQARLANELARIRAQWLMDNMKVLFKQQYD